MTFEELKAEAWEQGYNLIKRKPPLVRLLPCPCGRKQLSIWHRAGDPTEYQVSCPKCGKGENSEWKKSEREARELWNRMVSQDAADKRD